MNKIIIIYYSSSDKEKDAGATEYMAQSISSQIKKANVAVTIKKVDELIKIEELQEYDAIIVGTPCYMGNMAGPIKEFFDKTYKLLGKLEGKIGGAFATSTFVGGGNETALMAVHHAFLVHGMIIQGDYQGDHYGPVAVSPVGDIRKFLIENAEVTERFAKRIVELTKKIKP
ncbi:MAG: NAD(P)H-dependent oxidoreductase [Thermodesulfobacteriota bacterium]|nr:NAD(P)H-dependent oxidoreductase [Thermodesulfobacteriota bacterium]